MCKENIELYTLWLHHMTILESLNKTQNGEKFEKFFKIIRNQHEYK